MALALNETRLKLQHKLKSWLTNPGAELSRTSRTLRFTAQLALYVARELKEGRAPQIAAALSFRTLFSLLPLVVVVLMVFKTLGLFDQALPAMRDTVFSYLDLHSPAGPQMQAVKAVGAASSDWFIQAAVADNPLLGLKTQADDALTGVQGSLERMDFGTIGWIGLIVFAWSALKLIVSAEDAFNQIVKSPTHRGWTRRVVVYWAVITLGPVLLVISLTAASLVAKRFETLPVLGQYAVGWGNTLIAFGSAWLLFFLAYRHLPNRKLSVHALAIGALVTALLWEIWKHAFRIFIRQSFGSEGMTANTALYGSVALLPVFFMWVQITWLFVLFGLSFAYSLHAMPTGDQGKYRQRVRGTQAQKDGVVDARWTLPLLACIADAFEDGGTVTSEHLAAQTALPQIAVDRMLGALVAAGLVHETAAHEEQTETNSFALAAPARKIQAAAVLAVIEDLADNKHAADKLPGVTVLRRWIKPERDPEHATTLADLLDEHHSE